MPASGQTALVRRGSATLGGISCRARPVRRNQSQSRGVDLGIVDPRSNHGSRHGVLAGQDPAVGDRARAVHATRRRRHDRRLSCSRRSGCIPRANPDFFDTLVALRFLERDGDGRDGALSQHAGDGAVPRSRQPALHGRLPRDGQRAPLPLLGRSHRGAANRQAAERNQARRRIHVRRAVQQAGAARAVHGRDGRDLGRQLPGVRREVRLPPLHHAVRRRRRDRPAVDARRAGAPAHAVRLRGPAGRHRDRRAEDRGRRTRRPRHGADRSTSSPSRCPRPT